MSDKQANSKWNNPAFLHSLMLALYVQLKGNLNKEAKDAIEEKMHRDGFEDVTWEAIRNIRTQNLFLIITTNKMSRATMKWTPEADQQILVAMVKTMTPNADQYSAIIQELHSYGYSCTVSALKQHIQKLQRKEQTAGDSVEASSTPVKKGAKKATTPRKRKTPVKKAKNESEAEDDVEQEEAPAPKKPRTPKKPSMKEEADEFLNTEAMTGDRFEPNGVEI